MSSYLLSRKSKSKVLLARLQLVYSEPIKTSVLVIVKSILWPTSCQIFIVICQYCPNRVFTVIIIFSASRRRDDNHYNFVQIFELYLYFQFNLLQFNVKLDNCKISIIHRSWIRWKLSKVSTFCNIVNVKLF